MSNHHNQPPPRDPLQSLINTVAHHAHETAMARLSGDKGKAAAAKIFDAVMSAVRTARNPSAFATCTEGSIITCIALSMETDLYPGGPNPSVYLVPQSPRKGAPPEMQWRLSARGMMKLANRAGYSIICSLVSANDQIDVQFGEAVSHRPADISVQPGMEDTVGAVVTIRRATSATPLVRYWVARSIIDARRASGNDGEPWSRWWASMAQGAAIRETFARGVAPIEEMEAIMQRETSLDIQAIEAHAEPAAATPPPARAFNVPPPARAIAAPNGARQIAGPPIEEDWTPPPFGDPVPTQQAAPPAQAATPADPVKTLRAQRATLIAEIADLSGISGDTVTRARAVMRAAGCAEVANPDEAALTTQIDLLTAHLAEAKVAALERDGSPDAR
jgi:recombinational DNA repair protein RecT